MMPVKVHWWLCFALFLLSACTLPEPEPEQNQAEHTSASLILYEGFSIEPIELIEACSAESVANEKAFVLFDENTNRIAGWSHIKSKSGEFSEVKLERVDYVINKANAAPDLSCGDIQTYPAVLVKKYADWDRQHANGIEMKFLDEGIRFSNVESIVIELKLESSRSTILSVDQLASIYGDFLTAEQLNEWDFGKVNLGFTLFETGFDNQSSPSFTASQIIEIDQEQYADRWLRVTIPAENLDFFTEQNYDPTPADLASFSENLILGLRVNPETGNGRTVRSYIPDTFDGSVPEQFKEMGIRIKKIEIQLAE